MRRIAAIAALALLGVAGPSLAQDAPAAAPPSSVAIPGKSEDIIIAPREKRAASPDGDPRSVGEMREHRIAFDKCVLSAAEPDSFRPVDSTPEERCSQSLGMSSRTATPNSVKQPLNENEE